MECSTIAYELPKWGRQLDRITVTRTDSDSSWLVVEIKASMTKNYVQLNGCSYKKM